MVQMDHRWDSAAPAKLSLALSYHRFIVPWTPVVDSDARYLRSLTLHVTRSDSDVTDVRAVPEFFPAGSSSSSQPSTLLFFKWSHRPTADLGLGRAAVAGLSVLACVALVVALLRPVVLGVSPAPRGHPTGPSVPAPTSPPRTPAHKAE